MSDREMLDYIKSCINEKQYLCLYLDNLSMHMKNTIDKNLIDKEVKMLMNELNMLKDDYDFYIHKLILKDEKESN